MGKSSQPEREEVRREIRRILILRRVFKIMGWVLLIVALGFFWRQTYTPAIVAGLLSVACAVLADWVVKPPQ